MRSAAVTLAFNRGAHLTDMACRSNSSFSAFAATIRPLTRGSMSSGARRSIATSSRLKYRAAELFKGPPHIHSERYSMAHFLDGPGPCLLHRCPTALIRVSCSSQLTAALSVVSPPPSSYQPHNPQALCNLYRSTHTVDTLNVPRSMVCNVCWWSRL